MTAASDALRKLLGVCPVCAGDLAGHRFVIFGTAIVSKARVKVAEQFLGYLRNRDWPSAAAFHEFQGGENALVAYVISGPHTDGALVVALDPFELYAVKELVLSENLCGGDVMKIDSLVRDADWSSF